MERKDNSLSYDGINNNTYNMIFIDEPVESRYSCNNREFIQGIISQFTKLSDEEINEVLNKVPLFKRKKEGYIVKRHFKKYYFMLLDTVLKDEKENLRSDNRRGKCIPFSIGMANSFDKKCKVAIGYLDNSDKNYRVLHAVFVDCSKKEEYVLDYTINVIMKKKDYIELNDFRILNEISGEDIKKDLSLLLNIERMSTKFYLCFRDEIINDLEKNKNILKIKKI